MADCEWAGDGGVVAVAVCRYCRLRGGGGRMTASDGQDRRWKSETGASNFEAGATGRGDAVVAAAWL